MKNIMEEVRKFLRTYPPLAEGKLHVDFLPEEAQSYSVEAVPAKEIVRSYVGEGRKVMLMEATTSGYAMAAEASMARYQIQCRMEFFQTR